MKQKMVSYLPAIIYGAPSQFEAWLEGLAAAGWHPQKIGPFSSLRMTFLKGAPMQYRYVIDLQARRRPGYLDTYREFGWDFMGQMSSTFVWRKAYTGERPEAFSDRESLARRSRRFFGVILALFIMFLVAAVGVSVVYPLFFARLNAEQHIKCVLGLVLSYALTFTLGYILREIHKNRDV